MKYYVLGYYPPFKNGLVIGCVHHVTEDPNEADKLKAKLREKSDRALFFVHDEQGRGTSSLIEVRLD